MVGSFASSAAKRGTILSRVWYVVVEVVYPSLLEMEARYKMVILVYAASLIEIRLGKKRQIVSNQSYKPTANCHWYVAKSRVLRDAWVGSFSLLTEWKHRFVVHPIVLAVLRR